MRSYSTGKHIRKPKADLESRNNIDTALGKAAVTGHEEEEGSEEEDYDDEEDEEEEQLPQQ